MSEELYNQVEEELKGQMPEECLNLYKRLSLCKLDHDAEFKQTKGFAAFFDSQTDPFNRTAGCQNENNAYTKCYFDFMDRFIDLKNYVAEIEGRPLPYDRKELDKYLKRNLTKLNFGLNKF